MPGFDCLSLSACSTLCLHKLNASATAWIILWSAHVRCVAILDKYSNHNFYESFRISIAATLISKW